MDHLTKRANDTSVQSAKSVSDSSLILVVTPRNIQLSYTAVPVVTKHLSPRKHSGYTM